MSLFVWKPEYSVHVADLDSDHQKLFSILNSVYENVMSSREVDCVLPKIDQLSTYTNYHFSKEELYMREKGYSGIEDHIAKHREFTRSIEALRNGYHNNDLEVSKELIIVLGEWLLRHVLKEDRKYAELPTSLGE
ncbi:MAG: bacteriohemerythrin [Desulfuromonadaceae bacterium]|nr:bacteriohemerythrin [Desulfuromonadaceae bacterium]